MADVSLTELFRGIVGRVSERFGCDVLFQFGDWAYISEVLTTMGGSSASSGMRYPIVCLYSPYTEVRSGGSRSVSVELLIAVNTLREYSNEQREATSFAEVLRPLYSLLMEEIGRERFIEKSYGGLPRHRYTENYRYGRTGVDGAGGKPFRDYIDAIEIGNLELKIKKVSCL